MIIKRLGDNPIVGPQTRGYVPEAHDNINGPSLIRVPDWVKNPLGRYYLYFAHHRGDHIRMAYADAIAGPYTILDGGVFGLSESQFVDHLASPDVHVDHESMKIRMYYHGILTEAEQHDVEPEIDELFFYKQRTRVAVSMDGLHFEERPQVITSAYLRVVNFQDVAYGITMPGLLYRSLDGLTEFERGPLLFGDNNAREFHFFAQNHVNPRHFAVHNHDGGLRLFFSLVPGEPESIYTADIVTAGDWQKWTVTKPKLVLSPERDYEGANLPPKASERGWSPQPVRQLRDPGIFEENGKTFLLYSIAGEQGIAIAELM